MKKAIAIALILSWLAGLAACGRTDVAANLTSTEVTSIAAETMAETTTETTTEALPAAATLSDEELAAQAAFEARYPFVYTAGNFSIRYYVENGEAVLSDGWGSDENAPFTVPLTIDGLPIQGNTEGGFWMRKLHCSELIVPEGIKSVGVDLSSAQVAKLSASVESFEIGRGQIGRFEVDPKNPYLSSIDGVLFNEDGTVLVQYPTGSKARRYTIPSSCKEIAEYAFAFARPVELRELVIPPSVTVFPEQLENLMVYWMYQVVFFVTPGSAAETYFKEQMQSEAYEEVKERFEGMEPFSLRLMELP